MVITMRSFVVLFLFFAAVALDITGVWGNCAAVCSKTTAVVYNNNNNCRKCGDNKIFLLQESSEPSVEALGSAVRADEKDERHEEDSLSLPESPQQLPKQQKDNQESGGRNENALNSSNSVSTSVVATDVGTTLPASTTTTTTAVTAETVQRESSGSDIPNGGLQAEKYKDNEGEQQDNEHSNDSSAASVSLRDANSNSKNGKTENEGTDKGSKKVQGSDHTDEQSTSTTLHPTVNPTTTSSTVNNNESDVASVDIIAPLRRLFVFFLLFYCY